MKRGISVYRSGLLELFLGMIYGVIAQSWLSGCAVSSLSSPTIEAMEAEIAEAFVPFYLEEGAIQEKGALGQSGGEGQFYLAIRKDAMEKTYFLSAFMKHQAIPGNPQVASDYFDGPRSLGTRVVRFKVQNDKLLLFDASKLYGVGGMEDRPELVVDAFPIVENHDPFQAFNRKNRYILIDPAQGLNRFSVASNESQGWVARSLAIDAAYLQRFRRLTNGIAFDKIFAGNLERPDGGPSPELPAGIESPFRAGGTLVMTLSDYAEGEGFTSFVPGILANRMYFLGLPSVVPWSGYAKTPAIKWNVVQDRKPIRWLISRDFQRLQEENPGFDLVAAVKDGVESWNEIFGFTALEATLATGNEEVGDDDVNLVNLSGDGQWKGAFANFRINPNSGEIRGATVVLGVGVLTFWAGLLNHTLEMPPAPKGASADSAGLISWGGMPELGTFDTWDRSANKPPVPRLFSLAKQKQPDDAQPMTVQEFVRLQAQAMIAHEIGHTLGLRHNFLASTVQPVSSIMDYYTTTIGAAPFALKPGPYDKDAIDYLYGLSNDSPWGEFCSDEDQDWNPDCNKFDLGEPVLYYVQPVLIKMNEIYNAFATGPDWMIDFAVLGMDGVANDFLKFVRAANANSLNLMQGIFGFKSAPPAGMDPAATVLTVDKTVWRLLQRLYFDADSRGALFNRDPGSGVNEKLTSIIQKNLLDRNLFFESRRLSVDILKKFRTTDGYKILLSAKEAIAQDLPALTGDEALLTADLLTRIDKAISSYFD